MCLTRYIYKQSAEKPCDEISSASSFFLENIHDPGEVIIAAKHWNTVRVLRVHSKRFSSKKKRKEKKVLTKIYGVEGGFSFANCTNLNSPAECQHYTLKCKIIMYV